MIEITCNDRLGKKVRNHEKYRIKMILQVRIKCNEDDTIGDLKKLIAAQTGTKYELFCISVFETGRNDKLFCFSVFYSGPY